MIWTEVCFPLVGKTSLKNVTQVERVERIGSTAAAGGWADKNMPLSLRQAYMEHIYKMVAVKGVLKTLAH